MSANLRDLIANAEIAMDTYKFPDIGECETRLEEILVAAGLTGANPGSLGWLTIREGAVCMRFDWSVRGCDQSDDYSFPETILDAPDPIRAARSWGLEKRVNEAQWEVAEKRRTLEYSEQRLAKAETELAEFAAAIRSLGKEGSGE